MKNLGKISSKILLTLTLFTICFYLMNCSKDDPAPSTGKISGKVTDLASGSALSEATVIAFNAEDNSPVSTTTTDGSGNYALDVSAGNYFLKFYRQGYLSVPGVGSEAVPFEVVAGQTATQSAEMSASALTNLGFITGKVSVGTQGKSGVLVIAEANATAISAITDDKGNYKMFNVPAGSYQVKGFLSDFASVAVPAQVVANTATSAVNISLSQGASGQVSGTFKVISQTTIATPPATMDISLVHPYTRETIPGLSLKLTYSSSLNYSFSNVPDGTYIVRASYGNDYIVIDPDYVQKFGDYKVTVNGGVATPSSIDIVATSAAILTSPTNEMTTTTPVESGATPTFQWASYPSTSDYVIEVTDATTGSVIWGGFTNTSGTLTKNITIPSSTTSVVFNFDGKATSALVVGKVYRWKIYASKNNNQTSSWNLIAASEEQRGLIKIK
jgi:hypothetical protein